MLRPIHAVDYLKLLERPSVPEYQDFEIKLEVIAIA